MDTNGSGIEYPTIELGGKTYTVKFTGAAMWRMGKAGVAFRVTHTEDRQKLTTQFHNNVDVLYACIDFKGTIDELADLAWPKRQEVANVLIKGWGNLLLPSAQVQIRETAATPPTDLPTQ